MKVLSSSISALFFFPFHQRAFDAIQPDKQTKKVTKKNKKKQRVCEAQFQITLFWGKRLAYGIHPFRAPGPVPRYRTPREEGWLSGSWYLIRFPTMTK